MMKKRSLIFAVIILGCGAFSTGENDNGVMEDREHPIRARRNAQGNDQTAQLPQQDRTGSPFFMSPNIQSSYFLGQCVMCPPGSPGPRGAAGPQGMPGRDGRDQIIIGPISDTVIQRPDTPDPVAETSSSGGVTYTRWGRTSCPSTSQLVYEGVMGSSNSYNQKGSGVNFLCLPLEPTFADTPSYSSGGAYIFGVEYENNLESSRDIQNSEAPCAVCLSPGKQTVITIPATKTCLGSQDWTLEYQGYMMSSTYSRNKSEFVCIDHHAEGIPRTHHSNNENILYVADAKCSAGGGGLPCPPYVDGYDILCAVCTL